MGGKHGDLDRRLELWEEDCTDREIADATGDRLEAVKAWRASQGLEPNSPDSHAPLAYRSKPCKACGDEMPAKGKNSAYCSAECRRAYRRLRRGREVSCPKCGDPSVPGSVLCMGHLPEEERDALREQAQWDLR